MDMFLQTTTTGLTRVTRKMMRKNLIYQIFSRVSQHRLVKQLVCTLPFCVHSTSVISNYISNNVFTINKISNAFKMIDGPFGLSWLATRGPNK